QGHVRCAIVTATVAGYEAADVAARLADEGINTSVSTREDSVIDFGAKGIAAAVRISPHYYNTTDDVGHLVDVLAALPSRA
ncbi:MAG TPA: hypothetical protein VD948_07325, partial [Rhodothermales bacterium]|nr:hypothetical protein [Rhodothermales bacterium]